MGFIYVQNQSSLLPIIKSGKNYKIALLLENTENKMIRLKFIGGLQDTTLLQRSVTPVGNSGAKQINWRWRAVRTLLTMTSPGAVNIRKCHFPFGRSYRLHLGRCQPRLKQLYEVWIYRWLLRYTSHSARKARYGQEYLLLSMSSLSLTIQT